MVMNISQKLWRNIFYRVIESLRADITSPSGTYKKISYISVTHIHIYVYVYIYTSITYIYIDSAILVYIHYIPEYSYLILLTSDFSTRS